MPEDTTYTIAELADLAGVTTRTIRYYLAQGLLPSAGQTGPGTRYTASHLARLRVIRALQAEHLPLAEIRRRLSELDDDQVVALAEQDAPAPPPDSALEYVRAILRETPALYGRGSQSSPASRPSPSPNPASPSPNQAGQPDHSSLLRRIDAFAPLASSSAPTSAERLGESYHSAAKPGERSQWDRIVLATDVELHIRRPLSRTQNKRVDRLVTVARELLEEDPS